ncbi:MAG TPA: amidohydrolase family protein, partial [Thermoanaerobaculia bacterium]|nr:amidohydrolase family protein [Thermoanaerobaculia bacterium]
MKRIATGILASAALISLFAFSPDAPQKTFLIAGARVADGTGGPIVKNDVRVAGDRIVEVGALKPREGEAVVRGEGLVLAPGFIDPHNHSEEGLATDPLAETQVSQGITTLVVGPDGDSPWPIADFLAAREQKPAAVNVMTMVGHETVRSRVLGKDFRRTATADEISKMAELVDQGMREGAAGLSSGLEYDIGSYASTEELIGLSKPAARYGGFYMTHVRDEAEKTLQAFEEAIRISREGGLPLQISHIKLGTVGVWGKTKEAIELIDRARKAGQDVTADCYPYEAWH